MLKQACDDGKPEDAAGSLFLGFGHHPNHLDEANHSPKDDSDQEEPMRVHPVVEKLTEQ